MTTDGELWQPQPKRLMTWINSTLHLKEGSSSHWKPCTAFPQYARSEHRQGINHSAGWATYQALLRDGWEVVSPDAIHQKPILPLSGLTEDQRKKMLGDAQ